MSVYENFASKLNKEVYKGDTGPKQITMEDIAKCRGSSQSIPSLFLNNLRVFFTKGEVITDKKIRDILRDNGADKIDTISTLFKDAPKISTDSSDASPHTIIKDQKMAADLGKIFSKAADQIFRTTHIGGDASMKWQDAGKVFKESHLLVASRHEMEKQNPVDLLRSLAFEKANGIKNDGLKEHFINYMDQKGIIPKDEKGLKEAYTSFVKDMVEINPKNDDDKPKFKLLQNYIKDNTQEDFRVNLSLELSSGIMPKDPNAIASKFAKMKAPDLLTSFQEEKFVQLRRNIVTDTDRQASIEKLISSPLESFALELAKGTLTDDSHNFIKAYLKYEAAPNDKLRDEIIDEFIKNGSKQQINLPEDVQRAILDEGGDFSEAYAEAIKLYTQAFLDNEKIEKVKKEYGFFPPSEVGKSTESASNEYDGTKGSDDLANTLFKSRKKQDDDFMNSPVKPGEFGPQ